MTTIYDVAKAARVTAATVSVALSGRGVVNSETRARILKCAEELGYRPNLVARSLAQRHTRTIGLLVMDLANPFYAEVALAVERTARRAGYRVLIANTDGDEEMGRELLGDLAARRVDGVIAMPGGLTASAVRSVAASGLPIIPCLWEEDNADLAPSVGLDFAAGGVMVAEHLLTLGHRRIGVVVIGTHEEEATRLRATAFRDMLAQHGCPLTHALVRWGDSSLESGYAAARSLLALPQPPTAIYATNDLMAFGVLAAARDMGVRVPVDLSVVGFDDILLADHANPPLTTVRIDKPQLMAAATDLLLRAIAGEAVTSLPPFAPTLVVRQSTSSCTLSPLTR